MKLTSILFTLGLTTLTATALAATADSFQVKTLDGANVQINAQEVRNAYEAWLKTGPRGTNVQKYLVNDDGSVTLVEPRFVYAGQQLPFGNADVSESGIASGLVQDMICAFYGFSYSTWAETEATKEKFVLMGTSGPGSPMFEGTRSYKKSGYKYTSVTCQK